MGALWRGNPPLASATADENPPTSRLPAALATCLHGPLSYSLGGWAEQNYPVGGRAGRRHLTANCERDNENTFEHVSPLNYKVGACGPVGFETRQAQKYLNIYTLYNV